MVQPDVSSLPQYPHSCSGFVPQGPLVRTGHQTTHRYCLFDAETSSLSLTDLDLVLGVCRIAAEFWLLSLSGPAIEKTFQVREVRLETRGLLQEALSCLSGRCYEGLVSGAQEGSSLVRERLIERSTGFLTEILQGLIQNDARLRLNGHHGSVATMIACGPSCCMVFLLDLWIRLSFCV